jgi:hypothetical protein
VCNASVARFESRSRVTVLKSTALWWFVQQRDPFLPRFTSTRTLPPHSPTNRGQDPRRSPTLVYGLVYKGPGALAWAQPNLRLSCKLGKIREPTSGLEPLTCSLRVCLRTF